MKRVILKKVVSAAMAITMALGIMSESFVITASAEDGSSNNTSSVIEENQNSVQLLGTENSSSNPSSGSSEEVEPEPDDKPEFNLDNQCYITNYRVVDSLGNSLAKVKPGDKVIIAVTVIDERVKAESFGVPAGVQTGRIHVTMNQGTFSIPSASSVTVKMRGRVGEAISYTIEFRDVTYVGGKPDFSFGVSYTGENGTNNDNNVPLRVPYTNLSIGISQATDDVPAPTIILNSANYGNVAIAGKAFSLNTSAINTSDSLELENVSVQIVLPQGISMSTGNSQVLIGKVGKKGTINHTFNLIAQGGTAETETLPVDLIYSFEALVGGQRQQFTSTQKISINVQQQSRFDIQGITYDAVGYLGRDSYITVNLANKGKSIIYNVSAEVVSEDFTGAEVEFLGNINPGTSTDAEFNIMPSKQGESKGKVVVTYEDASGNEYKLEKEFKMDVQEEVMVDPIMPDDPTNGVPEEKTSFTPYIIGGVIIAGAAGLFIYKKKKAKRLAELEDEDEDI